MSVWLQDLSATAVGSLSRFLCPLLERLPSMQGHRASLFGTNLTAFVLSSIPTIRLGGFRFCPVTTPNIRLGGL